MQTHRANDRAVMAAYGFNLKMTEIEIVAELFKMYEKLAEGEKKQTDLFAPNGTHEKGEER